MGVNAFDIKLLNGSAQEISYYDVETVTFPEASGSGVVKFTAGEPLDSSFVQIAPDFTNGDMLVDAPSGYVVRDALILKPSGMEAVIAKGASLMGVDGSYVTPGTSKSVTLDFASGSMSISAVGDERWAQIDIAQPATLLPENIKKSVTVAGIVGSYVTPGTTKAVTLDFSGGDMSIAAVGDERWAQIDIAKPSTLVPGNIKLSETIAGIVGTYVTPGTTKTVTLDFSSGDMSISAAVGERWDQINIEKPSTLIPGNVADGVEIAGIIGTLKAFPAELIEETRTSASTFVLSDGYFTRPITTMQPINFTSNKAISGINLSQLTSLNSVYFSQCSNLRFVSLPALTDFNAVGAFSRCGSLNSVYMPLATAIPSDAFSVCIGLWDISLPSVQVINKCAFYRCIALTTVYAPRLSKLGSSAFNGCINLSQLTVSEFVHAFPSNTFSECTTLSKLSRSIYYVNTWATSRTSTFNNVSCSLSSGTTLLADYLFTKCQSMRGITNIEDIETIGAYAFSNCNSLSTPMQFPKFVGPIYTGTFSMCYRVPSFSMPKMSGEVGPSAFNYCRSASTILLGSPTSIRTNAFQSCYKLISLYLLGTSVCSLYGAGAFASSPISNYSTSAGRWGSVYVRESLADAYKSATGWKSISARIVGITDAEIEDLLGG